ncbi:MAG: glycoside hydrolase family 78 protein [Bacteroidales bacterium]|jgi:alpha-L-rhamnosidase|nr:glycoside hydrolase family 78 protein [Bacteroidales bacterium]MCI2121255.1 glycoside hydrolase family 78 protein [Bacteroidales bacterium]MCI2146149.1 glycoside hydrolase family 78 protein [Bacteroidales bacterium]
MGKPSFLHRIAANATNICISVFQILLVVLLFASCNRTSLTDLRTEYMTDPLGIATSKPRFSWKMESTGDAVSQSAYRVMVARSEGDLKKGNYVYDSRKTDGSLSVGITYAGKKLEPSTRYFWKVCVWDQGGKETRSKRPAWFETAADSTAWKSAQWIGGSKPFFSKYRSRFIADFDIDLKKPIADFLFGYVDARNYCKINVANLGGTANFLISYVRDGKQTDYMAKEYQVGKDSVSHVRLAVSNTQSPSNYVLDVTVDSTFNFGVSISPGDKGETFNECRLYGIGCRNVFNVKLTDDAWGVILFDQNMDKTEWKDTLGCKIAFPESDRSAPMLRRTLDINKKVASARLYVTAQGFYDFTINGEPVGNDYFNPGWTDYRFRIMYNTYDVTKLLKEGANVLGATLGSGWYTDAMSYNTNRNDQYGIFPKLLCHLLIRYEDGTTGTVDSDGKWKVWDKGPYEEASWLNGVVYNSAKEIPGWDKAEFDDESWSDATLYGTQPDSIILQPYVGEPVRENMKVGAIGVVEPAKGVYVYDLGQNVVGIPCVLLHGAMGQKVTLKFAEMTYPDIIPTDPVDPYTIDIYKEKKGLAYTDNLRGALATDVYICRGDATGEVFEPKFTSHGFRYIQIEGLDTAPALSDVSAIVLNSVGNQTSRFDCSDTEINRLFQNIVWGERGNFLSIPTDCPQRDERMGWMGDAQIFSRSACYNMNVDQFYTRWMYSIRDDQDSLGNYTDFTPTLGAAPGGGKPGNGAMGWTDAGIIVPWEVYLQYGDTRILEDHYESMCRFMDFLQKRAVDHIQPPGGYGDWLALEGTPTLPTNTAYSAYDAWIMTHVATALGHKEDSARFARMYYDIKETYNKVFVNEDGYTVCPDPKTYFRKAKPDFFAGTAYVPNDGHMVNTQTSYVVPLRFGLFDEKNEPLAVEHLKENIEKNGYRLSTGFIGTPYLCTVLSAAGCDSTAFKLFEQTEYPSWLYPVLQGATTIWERWNSYTIANGFGPVSMNSFNHYSYGAIEEWMFSYLLGIEQDYDHPGYKHFILQPRAGGSLSYVTGSFESPYGTIASHWEKKEDGSVSYTFSIPANTSATLKIDGDITFESGVKRAARNADGSYELPSGTYTVIRK